MNAKQELYKKIVVVYEADKNDLDKFCGNMISNYFNCYYDDENYDKIGKDQLLEDLFDYCIDYTDGGVFIQKSALEKVISGIIGKMRAF